MEIRRAAAGDGARLAALIKHVEATSEFMMYGPGERVLTAVQQEGMIARLAEESNTALFVAEKDGELIGYLFAIGGGAPRKRHCAYIVAGIAEAHRGSGTGTRLFGELLAWASQAGIHRLELTVMAHNEAAIGLYKKMGFQIEGTKHHSLFINSSYIDEYYMYKLI
ncbi:GNAT family N-acetyltransferase [Neobacillus piezotolerans]|uniref:GNAT family N-acetyltransferase n=1 Tax=Neobacillus piezotolerans TaxID=2259171 RepID=A0A3D8GSQ7_9BACI|nr:GNAT family N-acetyltransferase [Neobacillus piezotolerans]RDU37478.1 GNAT family N-acetyltransferase [Neobacillus piezotolerans]